MRIALIFALLFTAPAASPVAVAEPSLAEDQRCATDAWDRLWLAAAVRHWRTAARDYLRSGDNQLPQIVLFDSRCSYALEGKAPRAWSITVHEGEIMLPNGAKIPPGPNAFNGATDDGANFVVMSLPSIWRPVAPRSEIPLEWFLEGVFLHEMSHAFQSEVTPYVAFPALLKRSSLSSDVSDDSVQQAFKSSAAYVGEYVAERDLLFRAAAADTDARARALACQSLEKLRVRRARYFVGPHAYLASVDELALTTEGLGEWVSYTWLTEGRGLSSSLVLSKVRGSYWSQEHGLALFLAIDRLLPRWQGRLFAKSPATAERLLALSCKGPA